jgi:hypothetical protein
MKETNQDKGGKIVGLIVGALLLQTAVGMHLDSAEAKRQAASTGLYVFLGLSLVHVVPLYVSVQQLKLGGGMCPASTGTTVVPTETDAGAKKEESGKLEGGRLETGKLDEDKPAQDETEQPTNTGLAAVAAWSKQMFLPPGYPESLDPNYTAYRMWQLLDQLIGTPKNILKGVIEWETIYGVGQLGATPYTAVAVSLYKTCVSSVIGLLIGLPAVRAFFNFKDAHRDRTCDIATVPCAADAVPSALLRRTSTGRCGVA